MKAWVWAAMKVLKGFFGLLVICLFLFPILVAIVYLWEGVLGFNLTYLPCAFMGFLAFIIVVDYVNGFLVQPAYKNHLKKKKEQ